jgi:hypothetical protein
VQEEIQKEEGRRYWRVASEAASDRFGENWERVEHVRTGNRELGSEAVPHHYETCPATHEEKREQDDSRCPRQCARSPTSSLREETQGVRNDGDDECIGGVSMERTYPPAKERIVLQPRDRIPRSADSIEDEEVKTRNDQERQKRDREGSALVKRIVFPREDSMTRGIECANDRLS